MKNRAVSKCGRYVAAVSPSVNTLKVFHLESRKEAVAYDVSEGIRHHLAVKRSVEITIEKMAWEPVSAGSGSDKIALQVSAQVSGVGNVGIVAVYDIHNFTAPIIVQQDVSEGIEDFFWVPPADMGDSGAEEGSYRNAKQVLVFTRNYLQVKLYSLDFVHILWRLCKPVSKKPIFNHSNANMWSLVLESRSADITDEHPVVYHFYNQGSSSSLLYRFRMPEIILSDELELRWSQSGKWLIYFNCVDSLFGFNLKVFNALGVNQRKFNMAELIPTGDPIININWLAHGMDAGSFSAEKYFLADMSVDSVSEYILVVSVGESNEIEVVTVSIKDFRVTSRELFSFEEATMWRQLFTGKTLVYQRGRFGDVRRHLAIRRVFTRKHGSRNLLVVQFDDSVLVADILLNDENSTKSIMFKPCHYISTDRIVAIDTQPGAFVVTTTTHIFSFDMAGVSVHHHQQFGTFESDISGTSVVVYGDSDDDWQVVSLAPQRRSLAASFTEENTDTFINKRAKRT